jgi:hypothetical protein
VRAELLNDLRRLLDHVQFQELICNAIASVSHLMIEAGQAKQLVLLFRYVESSTRYGTGFPTERSSRSSMRQEIRTTLHQTLWRLCRREDYAQKLVQHDVLPALLEHEGDEQVLDLVAFMCTKLADKFFVLDKSQDVANLLRFVSDVHSGWLSIDLN